MLKHSAIAWIARFRRDPFALLIACLAGLGTAHILVRTATYGAAVTTDSISFLSTALNFFAGEGWRDLAGKPLVGWPPLFPLLLAAFGWVGIEPLEAGRLINATAFGLTILAAGCWLRSNLRSRLLVLAATATLAASLPLSRWASHVMTDSLFVLLTLLALIQLAAFLNRKTAAPLWWAAVFTALTALTRYSGVVLIGTGVLVLLVRRAPPLAARLKHAIVFGAISSMPLAGVLTYNWAVSSTLTGRRKASGQSLSDGLSRAADVFRDWAIPPNAPDGFGYLLWMAAGLVVLAAGAVVVWSGRSLGMDGQTFGLGPVLPFGVFAIAYLVLIVAIVPLVIPVEFPVRYLLPMYVPLLVAGVFLLDRLLCIEAAGWMAAGRYVVASLAVLTILAHVGFSARENLRLTAQAWRVGYEENWMYNTARWQHSKLLSYLRDNRIEGKIYSNDRDLIWFANRTAAPGKHQKIYSNDRDLTWFANRTAAPGKHQKISNRTRWTQIEAGEHIVWFDRIYRPYLDCDGVDIRVLSGVETVVELADGVVLRRTAYEPFDAERHRAQRQRYVEQLIQQADEQVVRAGWNVYRTGRKLIYRKAPCAPADTQAKFVLHVVPADPADLPIHHQQYDSENLDFYFEWIGFRRGDQCIAIAQLPDYAIGRIYIGQWIAAENRTLWEAEFPTSR